TATMSAGKSTFINALTGKNVTLSQNTACTSKIHNIVGKPFDDGFTYESDHDIVMDAGREELLNDNEKNMSGTIGVSTYYNGELGGKRIVLRDTPGVNSSENDDHKIISENIIKSRKYKLMLYILNATQLGTNDDELHLEFVSKNIGRTPILFIMNKADAFEGADDDLETAIEKQRQYLKKIGFKEPMICPVSSRIGYLCKKSASAGLSRMEMLDLGCGTSRFEENSLAEYYEKAFPEIKIENSDDKTRQTLKNCGIAYVEKIIGRYCR
ncbi:MAG: dynamin family protein, partial [Muribaculaceae bacterium]|nr:dynamin family protein [Muribaculaceae bacterium]